MSVKCKVCQKETDSTGGICFECFGIFGGLIGKSSQQESQQERKIK